MRDATALFTDYLNCPYKVFLKLKGETGEISPYEQLQTTSTAEYRQRSTAFLSVTHPTSMIVTSPMSVRSAIRTNGQLFLDVTEIDNDQSWTFDAIESGKDAAGKRWFHPVRSLNAAKLTTNDKLLAAADSIKLAEFQKHPVEQVLILHGANPCVTKLRLTSKKGPTQSAKEAQKSLDALQTMMRDGSVEPKLVLNSHCDVCEFRQRCRVEAERRDDLSLLRGLRRTEIDTLNSRGIFTITQLAYTCRAKAIERSKTAAKKHNMPLQAMAIRDKTVYVRRKPELPKPSVSVYLDIEGIPERDFYYLIGMQIERPEDIVSRQFWADSEQNERAIWEELRQQLAGVGEYTLFHFGRYERTFLDQMQKKYGNNEPDVEKSLTTRLCDVHSMIRTNVFFPAYSNGLKPIASVLGAKWSGPIESGLDSIVWRHRWEQNHQDSTKESLLRYNMDDCIALRTVATFLANLDQPDLSCGIEVKTTEQIPKQSNYTFGPSRFALPEIAKFTKCAYFNYQRDKIFVRTNKLVRKRVRGKIRKRRSKSKVNERIECTAPTNCPECGTKSIYRYQIRDGRKVIQELRFTARGVKRWEVEYLTCRYQCGKCRQTFLSPDYPKKSPKLGHTVACWATFQQIVLKQTGYAVAECFQEMFGLSMSNFEVTRFRRRLSEIHETTEAGILERLRSGNLICADEAKFAIKQKTGYVWVFSSPEEVIYRFSLSREASVLEDILNGFGGVLVSDFYGAYDSQAFQQQKCLIHLIRDINDDLLKAPFNTELKEMAERFTALLKPIIEAIDLYGLKKRHLAKFLPKANQFLEWVSKQDNQTKVAVGYQKRFQKYGTRLFTFLSHDGIPWNNNLAENAVKLIASRRAILGASFSEKGIKDYLRLLSIYQTLRRKGKSFLRFLLSKETDLFKFVGE